MDDKDPVFDKKHIKEHILNPHEDGDDLDSYQTYVDKSGQKRVKTIKAEDTLKKIEYVIRAIKKIKEEKRPLNIPNIFYKVRLKKMKYSDVTGLYTTLEFDFMTEMADQGDGRWGHVLKEKAYEPLLGILEIYDGNNDYDEFTDSIRVYIGNVKTEIERGLKLGLHPKETLSYKDEFDSSKNL